MNKDETDLIGLVAFLITVAVVFAIYCHHQRNR